MGEGVGRERRPNGTQAVPQGNRLLHMLQGRNRPSRPNHHRNQQAVAERNVRRGFPRHGRCRIATGKGDKAMQRFSTLPPALPPALKKSSHLPCLSPLLKAPRSLVAPYWAAARGERLGAQESRERGAGHSETCWREAGHLAPGEADKKGSHTRKRFSQGSVK